MILPSKIEIYVKIEKVGVNLKPDRPATDAFQPRMSRWGWPSVDGQLSRVTMVMSENDELALKCAQEFADSEGLLIEVCDINTFRGKIRAQMKGVKTTPTIVIGRSRVEGKFTPEQLKNKLRNLALLNGLRRDEK
jgi:hypothetical protein